LPSTQTTKHDSELFENTQVVYEIETSFSQEFCCCGYHNITGELHEKSWFINHKKVYRLMKEFNLLYRSRIRVEPFRRDFIRL
jgi:hypothetical protein